MFFVAHLKFKLNRASCILCEMLSESGAGWKGGTLGPGRALQEMSGEITPQSLGTLTIMEKPFGVRASQWSISIRQITTGFSEL